MSEPAEDGLAIVAPGMASSGAGATFARVRRRPSFRAVFGAAVLGLIASAAVLAPWVAPWDPARQMLHITST